MSPLTLQEIRCASGRQALSLTRVEAIADLLDSYAYDEDWRTEYVVKSALRSLASPKLMCIDAAILAVGLMDQVPAVEPGLLAIHRRDRDGEECGHIVATYRSGDRYGAFAKSNYDGLGHRPAEFRSQQELALSYAKAYVRLGMIPLFYGVFSIEELCAGVDWRRTKAPLNFLSDVVCDRYQFSFSQVPRGAA